MTKIAIIQFPGSNCESESIRAIEQAGMEAEEFLWNRNPEDLKQFDGYFIVGGFSYEDRSRAGIIAALDPLMPFIRAEAEKGKPVLGICNGAQILVETGMVPGLADNAVGMALAVNKRIQNGKVLGTGFYNAWVHIQLAVPSESSAFSLHMKPGEYIKVPVAHGEGRFIIPGALLEEMKAKNLTLFRYCDANGSISEEFPINPNGAVYNLAAVTNVQGNVTAMMPHPERTDAGQPIFTSMREYIQNEKKININNPSTRRRGQGEVSTSVDPTPFVFTSSILELTPYSPTHHSFQLTTTLNITDNEAITVRNTLKQLGIDCEIKRMTHWEITAQPNTNLQQLEERIIASQELFNPRKENIINFPPLVGEGQGRVSTRDGRENTLLIRYKDDFIGQQKEQALHDRFGLSDITDLRHGTLWKISAPRDTIEATVQRILDTHILFNPYSQSCFTYGLY
ncbi:MAG: phosphoribosylformylglycinamidine synthase I [Patescibacteria group bacterium]|mgnify:CR=1 FL=1